MKLYIRGGFWWFDATMTTAEGKGRRLRQSTGIPNSGEKSRGAAHDAAVRIVSEAGEVPSPTLRQALTYTYETHWKNSKSSQAMRHMVDVLSRQLGHHDVRHITYGILKDYGDALLREGYAPATVNRRITAVGIALREQVRRGPLKVRPELPRYPENNKKERYMSAAEESAVLDYFDRHQKAALALRDHDKAEEWALMSALTEFLLDTGLRFSELFKFTVEGTTIRLKAGTTKNDKGRSVPMTERAYLASHVVRNHRKMVEFAGLLAANQEDKAPWDWIAYRWQCAVKEAGCPDVTLHILRHTCGSRLVQRGVSIYVVSKWLGHSSVKVTERYAHLAPNSLDQALAALQGGPVPVANSIHGTRSSHDCAESTDLRYTAQR